MRPILSFLVSTLAFALVASLLTYAVALIFLPL